MIFFDLVQDGHKVQIMCNKSRLYGTAPEEFKKFYRLLRRGDAFCTFHLCLVLVPGTVELNNLSRGRETSPYRARGINSAGDGIASIAVSLSP